MYCYLCMVNISYRQNHQERNFLAQGTMREGHKLRVDSLISKVFRY